MHRRVHDRGSRPSRAARRTRARPPPVWPRRRRPRPAARAPCSRARAAAAAPAATALAATAQLAAAALAAPRGAASGGAQDTRGPSQPPRSPLRFSPGPWRPMGSIGAAAGKRDCATEIALLGLLSRALDGGAASPPDADAGEVRPRRHPARARPRGSMLKLHERRAWTRRSLVDHDSQLGDGGGARAAERLAQGALVDGLEQARHVDGVGPRRRRALAPRLGSAWRAPAARARAPARLRARRADGGQGRWRRRAAVARGGRARAWHSSDDGGESSAPSSAEQPRRGAPTRGRRRHQPRARRGTERFTPTATTLAAPRGSLGRALGGRGGARARRGAAAPPACGAAWPRAVERRLRRPRAGDRIEPPAALKREPRRDRRAASSTLASRARAPPARARAASTSPRASVGRRDARLRRLATARARRTLRSGRRARGRFGSGAGGGGARRRTRALPAATRAQRTPEAKLEGRASGATRAGRERSAQPPGQSPLRSLRVA